MIKSNIKYLSEEDELKVLILKTGNSEDGNINTIVDKNTLQKIFKEVNNIHTSRPILKYIRDIIVHTRRDRRIVLGASTRAGVQLLKIGVTLRYFK